MQTNLNKVKISITIFICIILSGCSFSVEKKELTNAQKGFYKGAIICGVGGAIADKENRLRGAVVGGTVCGIIGGELGKRKDKKEKEKAPK